MKKKRDMVDHVYTHTQDEEAKHIVRCLPYAGRGEVAKDAAQNLTNFQRAAKNVSKSE